MYVYIYIYMYIHTRIITICIYIYIYIYICPTYCKALNSGNAKDTPITRVVNLLKEMGFMSIDKPLKLRDTYT